MTTTPNIGATEMTQNQSGNYLTYNDNLRVIDAVVQARVLDKDLTAPPGGESDGDMYIVGSTHTGAWSTFTPDNLAYYKSSGYIEIAVKQGWLVWIDDEKLFYRYDTTDGWVPGVTSPADMFVAKEGSPTAGEVIFRRMIVRPTVLLSDFSGSNGAADTPQSDSGGATFDVQVNGVSIGTVVFLGSEVTFATVSGADLSLAAGDVVTVVAPTPADSTLADLCITLFAYWTGA